MKGAYAYDVDGNQYVDYVGTWGPAICGHANDEVNEALRAALEKGTSFGAPSENDDHESLPRLRPRKTTIRVLFQTLFPAES